MAKYITVMMKQGEALINIDRFSGLTPLAEYKKCQFENDQEQWVIHESFDVVAKRIMEAG